YRRYRAGADAWALGRFVCPAPRLEEFARELEEGDRGIEIAATAPAGGVAEALEAVRRFHQAEARARVTAFEARLAGEPLPTGLETYWELDPASAEFEAQAMAVKAAGDRAKLRTGGVQTQAIPSVEQVLRFLEVCERLDLPFKATAGLHHAHRGPEYAGGRGTAGRRAPRESHCGGAPLVPRVRILFLRGAAAMPYRPFLYTSPALTAWFWTSFGIWGVMETWVWLRELGGTKGENRDRGSRVWVVASVWLGIWAGFACMYSAPSGAMHRGAQAWFDLGIAMVLGGAALRLWAIRTLGQFFRTSVIIQGGHRIITRGPYHYLRNPSYT